MNTSRILSSLIEGSNGRFVTVTFQKKDGSIRVINGRLGVTKGLKGGKSSVNPDQYITIYDMQAQGYRNINRDTILQVQTDGVVALNAQRKG